MALEYDPGLHPSRLFLDLSRGTTEQWLNAELVAKDKQFAYEAMAAAYDAAVYSILRHEQGDPRAGDLPVGAAIIDHGSGLISSGIASDQELGDPRAHAEFMALQEAAEHVEDWSKVTVATSLEPCVICVDELHARGVQRVIYGAPRTDIEDMNLVNRRPAVDQLLEAKALETDVADLEILVFPDPAVRAACRELFYGIQRNRQTGAVSFDPQRRRTTRYMDYLRDLEATPRKYSLDGETIQLREEKDIILGAFRGILEQFYHHGPTA